MLRIAFEHLCDSDWVAGSHYLKNLFIALHALDARPEILLFSGRVTRDEDHGCPLAPYVDGHVPSPSVGTPRGIGTRLAFFLQRKSGIALGPEPPTMASFLRSCGIDVLFTVTHDIEPASVLPTLAWLPDFQHLHLPAMFTSQEIEARNRHCRRLAERATRIVLSSQHALRDLEGFAPELAHKARVVSFVAQLSASGGESAPEQVCARYHLPARFFYLPNQFWKHKNHPLVINALAAAKAAGQDLTVICTGHTYDYRHPGYFADLLTEISRQGLRENFIVLGMVSREETFALMRQALAVIQPSLFEGWSTTVEEVKSLGKPILLSDIEVHREQAPPQALFFDPSEPRFLAHTMMKIALDGKAGPDEALEARAQELLPARTQAFGRRFLDVAHEAVAAVRPRPVPTPRPSAVP